MAKILRNVRRAMRSGSILMRGSITGSALSLAMVTSFKESTLEKPTSSLNLDNMRETWSHKFLLQQSRLSNLKKDFENPFNNPFFILNCSVMSMEACSVTLTHTVIALQTVATSYCDNLTQLGTLLRLV